MTVSPGKALTQLRRLLDDGSLASFCADHGMEMLVAFGSAVSPDWPATPRDLDLAVRLAPSVTVLDAIESLIAATDLEQIDVLDLDRAGTLAHAEALRRGELLCERVPGTFAETQVQAIVEFADTAWMRDLQLRALAQR